MPVQCPECDQAHPVSPAQLQLEGGLIVCPHCGALFDALPRIVRLTPGAGSVTAGVTGASGHLAAPPAVIAGEIRPPQGSERREAGSQRFLVLLSAALLLLLLGYGFRSQLPGAALLAEAGCRAGLRLGPPCGAPADFDPAALDLRGHRLTRTSGAAGEFEFAARLINRGASPQPLPVIELTLEDRNGIALARERFTPRDYLPAPTAAAPAAGRLPAAGELAVRLVLRGSAREVAGYRFVLQPPATVGAGGEAD